MANPTPIKVSTSAVSTATCRGATPGNSKGKTCIAGVATHTSPKPVMKTISSAGASLRVMATPSTAFSKAGTASSVLRLRKRDSSAPPKKPDGISP